MAYPEVKLDTRALDRAARKAPRELSRSIKQTFQYSLWRLEGRLVSERLSGSPLRRRTGALARGWKVVVLGEGLDLIGVLFTSIPYARIQEYGGVIRPRKSRYLWIPGGELLTPAGVFRGWGQVDWSAVFYRPSSKNPRNRIALQRVRGSSKVKFIATLAPEVRIDGRMGLRALVRQDRPNRIRELNEAVRVALAHATRG